MIRSRDNPKRVTLAPAAHHALAVAARKALPNETGGILVGYRADGDIVVVDALTVVDRSSTRSRYVRDDIEANRVLHEYLAARGATDLIGYVGEWHSHPAPVRPSGMDVSAIRATARRSAGPIAMIICVPGDPWQFHGAVAEKRRLLPPAISDATVDLVPVTEDLLGPLPAAAVDVDGPIFISYRRSDGLEIADDVQDLLRAAGLVVWRDLSDLGAGPTTNRLEQALTSGLSGGVLVVTNDIVNSEVVKLRELPRLLQLSTVPQFSLSIANSVPAGQGELDYTAPDRLLGTAPARTLQNQKQCDARTEAGRVEIVREQLMHRLAQRRKQITEAGRIRISVQTRPAPSASDAGPADLHIRLEPGTIGRLPSRRGLANLMKTLSVTSDAVFALGPHAIQLRGGMHLSVALALGGAFPETRVGEVEILDVREVAWSSRPATPARAFRVVSSDIPLNPIADHDDIARVAVFVTLTEGADESAFTKLLATQPNAFKSAKRFSVEPIQRIDAFAAGNLALAIGSGIKAFAAAYGRGEVHLAYHGPFPVAVLLARYLNTVDTIVYEWSDHGADGPTYYPVLRLKLGLPGGPIAEVFGVEGPR